MSLQHLVEINEKSLFFTRFETDHAGQVNWNGGKLEGKDITVNVSYEGNIPQEFIGDGSVSSSDIKLKGIKLFVGRLSVSNPSLSKTRKNNASTNSDSEIGDSDRLHENNNDAEYKNYVVLTDKTYFYTSADETTKRKAFLLKDQLLQACCEKNGFLWTRYTNDKGATSDGWIKINDLDTQK